MNNKIDLTAPTDPILLAVFSGKITEREGYELSCIVQQSKMSSVTALKLFFITRSIDKVCYYGGILSAGITVTSLLNDAIRDNNGNNISLINDINSFKIAFYVEKENATIPIYILSPEDISSMASTITDRIMQLSDNLKSDSRISREWLLQVCTNSIVEKVANKFHAVKDKDSIEIKIKDNE